MRRRGADRRIASRARMRRGSEPERLIERGFPDLQPDGRLPHCETLGDHAACALQLIGVDDRLATALATSRGGRCQASASTSRPIWYHRLRRETLQQRNLLIGEGANFLAINRERADYRVILAQRYNEAGTGPDRACSEKGVFPIYKREDWQFSWPGRSRNRHPAVHRIHMPGDHPRFLRSQEHRHVGDVLGLDQPHQMRRRELCHPRIAR
jgi:hypothetical protein